MLSILDIFKIGIGPSSSHTLGAMRIARGFMAYLAEQSMPNMPIASVAHVQAELRGSLAMTGKGHGTPRAIMLGLGRFDETIAQDKVWQDFIDQLNETHELILTTKNGAKRMRFHPQNDIIFNLDEAADLHPNMMIMRALDAQGAVLEEQAWYSTGGGFIASADQLADESQNHRVAQGVKVPYPFTQADELLATCEAQNMSLDALIWENETAFRPPEETIKRLDKIVFTMMACIDAGMKTGGVLPGGLAVQRRARALAQKLHNQDDQNVQDTPEVIMDYLALYALAVNEQNAAGGTVVTAPTMGAAGIIPAVLRHYICKECVNADALKDNEPARAAARIFLLVCGAIGLLYKQRASISGAEMGCQGEIGVACSMAAAGLAHFWGASLRQTACAAEIGMEHNLGLTCDPVGGLVQIPCIERNAIGTIKAVAAARLALGTDPQMAKVSLDQVIETMRQTGLDMSSKYKETAQGGLAVSLAEC